MYDALKSPIFEQLRQSQQQHQNLLPRTNSNNSNNSTNNQTNGKTASFTYYYRPTAATIESALSSKNDTNYNEEAAAVSYHNNYAQHQSSLDALPIL